MGYLTNLQIKKAIKKILQNDEENSKSATSDRRDADRLEIDLVFACDVKESVYFAEFHEFYDVG